MTVIDDLLRAAFSAPDIQQSSLAVVNGPPPKKHECLVVNIRLNQVACASQPNLRLWAFRSRACKLLSETVSSLLLTRSVQQLALNLLDGDQVRPFRLYSVTLTVSDFAHPWVRPAHDPFTLAAMAWTEFSMDAEVLSVLGEHSQVIQNRSFADLFSSIKLASDKSTTASDTACGIGAWRLALKKFLAAESLASMPEFTKLGSLLCRLAHVAEDLGDEDIAVGMHGLALVFDMSAGRLDGVMNHLENLKRLKVDLSKLVEASRFFKEMPIWSLDKSRRDVAAFVRSNFS